MNRKKRRALARMRPEEIDAFISDLCAEAKDEAFHQGQAQMLCLVLAFLHINKRHTGTFLRKWLRELDSFAVSVNGYGAGSLAELHQILREECGFDMEQEYGALIGERRDGSARKERGKEIVSTALGFSAPYRGDGRDNGDCM